MTPSVHLGKRVLGLLLSGLVAAGFLMALTRPVAGIPPVGTLLDPLNGLYRTARIAEHPASQTHRIDALQDPVAIVRDDRGVPHIFAESDQDAIIALGYVVAQDRLFQLDFIPRVASGRLSEVFGPASLNTDRFLRQTGMEWGARKYVAGLRQHGGMEREIVQWFAAGANAYIDALEVEDLPFEFRLLGYEPDRYTEIQSARLLQYFAYDLTFRGDAARYQTVKERLSPEEYATLYPRNAPVVVPIIPEPGGGALGGARRAQQETLSEMKRHRAEGWSATKQTSSGWIASAEGFIPGKGSNNWVVSGARSTTGAPILAGDMHLSLTLPAIWYEVHLVTPTMNTYGVTAPGTPLPVEAFNEYVAWAFTNTGGDVLDTYALELDETGTRYRFEDGYRDLDMVLDTIEVKGREPVVDTLYYAHWGPVVFEEGGAKAIRWAAHEPSGTLRALWHMNHARNYEEFQVGLEQWDTPMQNIIYADVEGNIAIRSTGYMPIREAGHGVGVLDGSSRSFEWVGRVPFDDLPHSFNPAHGFLSSTNQQPADSTYPYYLGHDWRSVYRSLRIDSLLRSKPTHSVDDFKRYQADVHAVQRDLFVPLLDTLVGLSPRADTLRRFLAAWSGETTVDRPEPLVLDEFLRSLRGLAWDEPVFDGARRPGETILYRLLLENPSSTWLDVQATGVREDAAGLLRLALEATADTMAATYGGDVESWRWGDHHRIVFRHLTQSPFLRALWRGPYEYPGFASTLSPAGSRMTTHSASWRVIVDFSQTPPVGYGVYPGGQSGHPFSPFYDSQVASYVQFEYYDLLKPSSQDAIDPSRISSRLSLHPASPR